MMQKLVRFAVVFGLALVGLTAIAAADVRQVVTVDLSLSPCNCSWDLGEPGGPAAATADFTAIAPWTFSFTTANPLSWMEDGGYVATFGYGGSFTMTGPGGLTFNGVVTSGFAGGGGGSTNDGVDVTFLGQWSNGLPGYGSADTIQFNGGDTVSDLTSRVVPEVSSLGLLASGVLGVWGFRYRLR